jgi:hypothetical protein
MSKRHSNLRLISYQGLWQHGTPVTFAFAVTHGNLFVFKVNVLDQQADTLHQSEPRTVQQGRHQVVRARELRQYSPDLLKGQDNWHAQRAFGPFYALNEWQIKFQYVTVEKQQGTQSYVLCRGSHVGLAGEMREVLTNFIYSHVARVTLLVVKDEATDCLHISFFCANAIMLQSKDFADLIEQPELRHEDSPSVKVMRMKERIILPPRDGKRNLQMG